MALHEQSVGQTSEWYTPSPVFKALDCVFDVDVASPGQEITPWIPALDFLTHDSLSMNWNGFAWINPPVRRADGFDSGRRHPPPAAHCCGTRTLTAKNAKPTTAVAGFVVHRDDPAGNGETITTGLSLASAFGQSLLVPTETEIARLSN
jgi:hypothetical protein